MLSASCTAKSHFRYPPRSPTSLKVLNWGSANMSEVLGGLLDAKAWETANGRAKRNVQFLWGGNVP